MCLLADITKLFMNFEKNIEVVESLLLGEIFGHLFFSWRTLALEQPSLGLGREFLVKVTASPL